MTLYIDIPNLDDLVQRYLDGESALKLSKEAGVCDRAFRNRLTARGIAIRSKNSYPPHVAEAHAARRGKRDGAEVMHKRALSRERLGCGTSHREDEFAALLSARGVPFTRQKAIGRYNVDFALTEVPLAVEVSAGGGNSRRQARAKERTEYLLNVGWYVLQMEISGKADRISDEAIDRVVAAACILRANPSAPREHRMIRADGKDVARRRRNPNRRA